MSLSIRSAPARDPHVLEIVTRVFSGRRYAEPERPPRDDPAPSVTWLAESDGVAAGTCKVFDFRLAKRDVEMLCGGVANVATLVEHRGSGVAGELMRHALREMRSAGTPISALYPFRASYYRKFGWEVCGWRWRLRVPTDRLPSDRPELPGRPIEPDEILSLKPCYERFVRSLSGSFLRTAEGWHDRLGDKPPLIYAFGDPIEAYCMTGATGWWSDIQAGEIAWSTPRGHRSALALLRSVCANQTHLIWNEPPNSPFLAESWDQGVEAKPDRESMFRIVDLPAAFRALKPTSSGEFTVEVHDDVLPENKGPWRIAFGPAGVEVEPAKTADLSIDIRPLSQAFMGSPSLAQIAAQGRCSVANSGALRAAEGLLEPAPVVCMDFF